jgi:low affinity Fe/Cu permease
MNNFYLNIERRFELLTEFATKILGNSISFLAALFLVLFWWTNDFFSDASRHQIIGDIIFGTTFLSLFIIQKSFNRYSASLNLKMNELISSHEPANNEVMNTNEKTEREIRLLEQEYVEGLNHIENELDEGIEAIKKEIKIEKP